MRACSKFGLCSQIGPLELWMPVCWSAWYHISEDYNFNIYGHENFTFHIFQLHPWSCVVWSSGIYCACLFLCIHCRFCSLFNDHVIMNWKRCG